MSDYNVLDLFSGLGGFSAAFEDSDRWDVTTVDIEAEFNPDIRADVFDLRPSDFDTDFDVVLASPPCTQFSRAGNHDNWDHENHVPTSAESKDAVGLIYHTLGLIKSQSPAYWFLENPLGRLRWFLGKPTGAVSYCQYGKDYMKPTDIWGDHPPMAYLRCNEGDNCHQTNQPNRDGGKGNARTSGDTAAERSKVPSDLSEVIRDACEAGLDGTAPKQTNLTDVMQQ